MTSSVSSQPYLRHGEPAYTHDCRDCQRLGAVDRLPSYQILGDVTEVDLYAHYDRRAGCVTDVVARYGNKPAETIRNQGQHPLAREPHLEAAAARSRQLGLLPVDA